MLSLTNFIKEIKKLYVISLSDIQKAEKLSNGDDCFVPYKNNNFTIEAMIMKCMIREINVLKNLIEYQHEDGIQEQDELSQDSRSQIDDLFNDKKSLGQLDGEIVQSAVNLANYCLISAVYQRTEQVVSRNGHSNALPF